MNVLHFWRIGPIHNDDGRDMLALSGIAVHLASRVLDHAAAGEVLVSRTVKDLVVGSGVAFDPRGEAKLRDVPGSWQTLCGQCDAAGVNVCHVDCTGTQFPLRATSGHHPSILAGWIFQCSTTGGPVQNAASRTARICTSFGCIGCTLLCLACCVVWRGMGAVLPVRGSRPTDRPATDGSHSLETRAIRLSVAAVPS